MRKITLPLMMLFGACASASSFAATQSDATPERLESFECTGLVNSYNADSRTFVLACQNEHGPDFQTKTVVIDNNTQIDGVQEANLDGATIEVDGVVINNQNIAREIELSND
ncbi:hypothetical protein GCM10007906_34770 [Vibrio hyugaensis]|uniref:DUF5666 domain-containing protein n=1 Tax=Vibrio hyugaensis TaxID=1534743 RepID=A0ABQ5Y873_9VIBR|nr:DUF5666 domain-containing protein [Vibrio hyugaensis]GLR05889.1 hypothetical protein GCM10007906_34770 [Vibrio hyugaensis]